MINCLLCHKQDFVKLLDKEPIIVWTGVEDDVVAKTHKIKCQLFQCCNCGHVQQPPISELETLLTKLYDSTLIQGTTPIGIGNWGQQRSQWIINELKLNGYKSALEIGCADGFLLRYLQTQGMTDLIGIEPSLKKSYSKDGISYIKENVKPSLLLNKKFDLIYSVAVFEHIKDINGVMRFVHDHLADKGELFFVVPNALLQLKQGDPALFVHQHFHYFTENTLTKLLSENGFKIKSIKDTLDSYFVHAEKVNSRKLTKIEPHIFSEYSQNLEEFLERLSHISKNKRLAFHGVSGSLHNILSWLKLTHSS